MSIDQTSPHRLPITHPAYRYPASKNPYWTKLQEYAGLVFCDNEGELFKGQWREKFLAVQENPALHTAPLHVEIGCNAGHVLVEWARANPDKLYIGIDWKFKPIFRGAQKAKNLNLKNILFLRAHAERLIYLFDRDELNALYLFFPDPWAKKAQKKNRFFTTSRLAEIASVIRPGGLFHVKTDHAEYFEWMTNIVKQNPAPWTPTELSWDLHATHPAPHTLKIPDVTLFEKLFIKDGLPIHSLKLRRELFTNTQ